MIFAAENPTVVLEQFIHIGLPLGPSRPRRAGVAREEGAGRE